MTASRSDALVLFGVTGDLAHKMIFPALYALAKKGALQVPGRRRRLVEVDPGAIAQPGGGQRPAMPAGSTIPTRLSRLNALLGYVSGNYNDPATFAAIEALAGASARRTIWRSLPRCSKPSSKGSRRRTWPRARG